MGTAILSGMAGTSPAMTEIFRAQGIVDALRPVLLPESRCTGICRGDGAGLSRFSGVQHRGGSARLYVELLGRASLQRLEPEFGDLDAADGAGDAHIDAARRHRGHRAALAQSCAARGASGDARS